MDIAAWNIFCLMLSVWRNSGADFCVKEDAQIVGIIGCVPAICNMLQDYQVLGWYLWLFRKSFNIGGGGI